MCILEFQPFLTNPLDLKGRRIFEKLFLKICKEYCLIPKGFRLNDPVQYFEHSTNQHKTFNICIEAYELLRNETLQLCFNHQRYVMKKIKEGKQFISPRLPHSFDELKQCPTTFLKQKKNYFCKIQLSKLNHLWSSHLHFYTLATKTHSNRSSVLLLGEWTTYRNDSVSRKKQYCQPFQHSNNH